MTHSGDVCVWGGGIHIALSHHSHPFQVKFISSPRLRKEQSPENSTISISRIAKMAPRLKDKEKKKKHLFSTTKLSFKTEITFLSFEAYSCISLKFKF